MNKSLKEYLNYNVCVFSLLIKSSSFTCSPSFIPSFIYSFNPFLFFTLPFPSFGYFVATFIYLLVSSDFLISMSSFSLIFHYTLFFYWFCFIEKLSFLICHLPFLARSLLMYIVIRTAMPPFLQDLWALDVGLSCECVSWYWTSSSLLFSAVWSVLVFCNGLCLLQRKVSLRNENYT